MNTSLRISPKKGEDNGLDARARKFDALYPNYWKRLILLPLRPLFGYGVAWQGKFYPAAGNTPERPVSIIVENARTLGPGAAQPVTSNAPQT